MSGRPPDRPELLPLPERPAKPRTAGITHVLDKGVPLGELSGVLAAVGGFVDVWKFGYGLAYLDVHLSEKVELLGRHRVRACPGGTLTEVAWLHDRVDRYLGWLEQSGIGCVEVSNGATGMPVDAKHGLITMAADRGFEVFAEVGSKDPDAVVAASAWVAEAREDVEAGAAWIVAEGRESGSVGLYDPDGGVRSELVESLEGVGASAGVIYEAPRRAQQAWLVLNVGPNVNLGNIAITEVASVEALRLGLRADTIALHHLRLQRPCTT